MCQRRVLEHNEGAVLIKRRFTRQKGNYAIDNTQQDHHPADRTSSTVLKGDVIYIYTVKDLRRSGQLVRDAIKAQA